MVAKILKARLKTLVSTTLLALLLLGLLVLPKTANAVTQESGSVGVEGTIPSPPPTQTSSITTPRSGEGFTSLPINVAGLCPQGLLVEIFDNGVFVGSVECSGGSFQLQIDLFEGTNDLIARGYDALNQASPDSATTSVTFNSTITATGPGLSIISNFAKRGADPGTPLTWPLAISGGTAPYAVSVDWGDKSAPDLISQTQAGDFTIQHTYTQAGTYNVTIKVTDSKGATAFLQVIAVANGSVAANTSQNPQSSGKVTKDIVWWPSLVSFGFIGVSFWIGMRHQLEVIRNRLRKGDRAFK